MTRKIWMDTEFLNRGAGYPLELISIGMVDDKGDEFYGIRVDSPLSGMWLDVFFREHVWPHLPLLPVTNNPIDILDWDPEDPDIERVMTDDHLREEVLQFIIREGQPELWGWCCGFDTVVLSQLFGTFGDKPGNLPIVVHDIDTLMLQQNVTVFDMAFDLYPDPEEPMPEVHHALGDARDVKLRYEWLMRRAQDGGVNKALLESARCSMCCDEGDFYPEPG